MPLATTYNCNPSSSKYKTYLKNNFYFSNLL